MKRYYVKEGALYVLVAKDGTYSFADKPCGAFFCPHEATEKLKELRLMAKNSKAKASFYIAITQY